MYRGLSQIWSGWSKNLYPGLKYSMRSTAILTTLMFIWTCAPFALLAFLLLYPPSSEFWLVTPLTLVLVAVILATDLFGHRVRGYRWSYFWTFPLGMLMICLLFWTSAIRIQFGLGATWKGRTVETQSQRLERQTRQEIELKARKFEEGA